MKPRACLAVFLLIDSVDNGAGLQHRNLYCAALERAPIISSVPVTVKLVYCYKKILWVYSYWM